MQAPHAEACSIVKREEIPDSHSHVGTPTNDTSSTKTQIKMDREEAAAASRREDCGAAGAFEQIRSRCQNCREVRDKAREKKGRGKCKYNKMVVPQKTSAECKGGAGRVSHKLVKDSMQPDPNTYAIDAILKKHTCKGSKVMYLVRWEGHGDVDNTWCVCSCCVCLYVCYFLHTFSPPAARTP